MHAMVYNLFGRYSAFIQDNIPNREEITSLEMSGNNSKILRDLPKAIHLLRDWWKKRVFHPIAFAILPVASIVASNISEISPRSSVRALLFLLGISLLLLLALRFLSGGWHRAGFLTSILLLLFFSYGHVYYGLVSGATTGLFSSLGLIGSHRTLVAAGVILLMLSILVAIRVKEHRNVLTFMLNIAAAAGLLVPLFQIGGYELRLSQPLSIHSENLPTIPMEPSSTDRLPDLYYIVLDGYGREDVLAELFDYDNGPFLEELKELGFEIADRSRSNYVQTSLSLASSLNLTDLQSLSEDFDPSSENRLPLARMIRASELRASLEGLGYTTIGFASGYRMTELENADVFIRPPQRVLNPMEGLLFETSGAIAIQDWVSTQGEPVYYPGYASHRELVLHTLEQLPLLPNMDEPKFVFAHVVSPHPPFVFGSEGETVDHHFRYSFRDGDAFLGSRQEYLAGYTAQLHFINDRILTIMRTILEESNEPPIIVLQGDHGPGLGLDYQSIENTDTRERLSILTAIYFGNRDASQFYPSLTPVNIFRVILNSLLGIELELLPDRSYYSTWDAPFRFILVPSE